MLLAGFAEEDHVLGLFGVGLRFCSWGFRVILLGPRTPPAAVARAVESLTPEVVALTISVSPDPPRARELVDAYADACRGAVWIVGGHGVDGLRSFIESRGGLVAGDLNELRATIERAVIAQRRSRKEEAR